MNMKLFILALIWAYMYNSHFGWDLNLISSNTDEVICDGIFAILMALSIGFKED